MQTLLVWRMMVVMLMLLERVAHASAAGCSAPPSISYTSRSGCASPYTHGESCTYRCQSGYAQISGSTTRTCSSGSWSGTNLACVRLCSPPPTLSYTTRSGCSSPYTQGETCTYRCNSGYTRETGNTVRTCSSGSWSGTNLICGVCSAPPSLSYTTRSGCASPYLQGERCTYRCSTGYYTVSGSTIRTCSSGRWSGTNLVCGCSTPPSISYTSRSGCASPYTPGERCTYSCISGYSPVSGSTTRTCSSGGWSGTNLVCGRTCSSPPTLSYTTRSGCSSPYTQGETCTYRCNSGYIRETGNTVRTCSSGSCSTPPSISYTSRSGCASPYTPGERCTYSCISGYSPVSGSTTRTCSSGGWSGTNLVCGRTCSSPPTLSYTTRSGCSSPYTQGETCTYRCNSGYIRETGNTVYALPHQAFPTPLGAVVPPPTHKGRDVPTGVALGCSTPPTISYTSIRGCASPFTPGERCTYSCIFGYSIVSGYTTRTCSIGGWSGTNLVCGRMCSAPPTISYTSRSGCSSLYLPGETCTYGCQSGYSRVSGSTSRTCSSGSWSGSNLVCRGADVPPLTHTEKAVPTDASLGPPKSPAAPCGPVLVEAGVGPTCFMPHPNKSLLHLKKWLFLPLHTRGELYLPVQLWVHPSLRQHHKDLF
ncbi:sushi, von Willebrand factor type A, EGF and pentraxin domain-containing protein 1-like [Branchiostoma lanceolatum]|uniref:sushi, von Willebrand factor type A, EGF and pentraxin domain-containing protein 1-like n=1 Tax=Branchiostoma lanceolatum TaxID=7740 RepID=UPI0034552DF5